MNPSTGSAMFAPDPRRGRAPRSDAPPKAAATGQGAWFGRIEAWLRGARRNRGEG